jgi:hypothetical protein
MVGAGASFKADPADRKRAQERLDVVPLQPTPQQTAAVSIGRVYMEDRLGDVEANEGNIVQHDNLLFSADALAACAKAGVEASGGIHAII